MTAQLFSTRIGNSYKSLADLFTLDSDPAFARRYGSAEACDFMFGNPHEMPLRGFVESLQQVLPPQNKDWFAYKMNEAAAREAVAATLRERRAMPFEAEDIFITNGAFAGIAAVLAAVTNPGDEVIYNSPPWFFYESSIGAYNAVPVRVKVKADDFDLDLDGIAAALTERTRLVIVNSPNNPTGRIYSPDTLRKLAGLLEEASARYGHPIYILSDEAYHRIVFDGREFYSPAAYYANTFVVYTYGKTLLTPGQRIGYIALPPAMPDRAQWRNGLMLAQFLAGYGFANALLQYALPELEKLSIDIPHLQRKRDKMVNALRGVGYQLHTPEGTFYLLVRSPIADDIAFAKTLARHNVYCLPGTVFECPGFFRISLTANDGMIERSFAGFEQALKDVPVAEPAAD